jgi:hypothetical protein
MTGQDQDWVTILEAAVSGKVPATAIRDWYQSGAIGSMKTTDGTLLVSLREVKAYANGDGKGHLHDERGRLTRTPEEQIRDGEVAATLNEAVNELQGMARDRLDTSD